MLYLNSIKLNDEILERQGVGLVVVFGSRITGFTHPGSDIDIGVVFFDNSKKKKNPVDVYGSLKEEFENKFKTKNIDIVYLEETPLSLQYTAVADGVVVYDKTKSFFADYKEKVIKKYFDFKFFEDIFNRALVEGK